MPWRIYERDRARDDVDRQERRRELDNTFRDVRRDVKGLGEKVDHLALIVEQLKDKDEAEANQRAGRVSVGKAIWIYILGGALLLVSIASGIVSIVVQARGG